MEPSNNPEPLFYKVSEVAAALNVSESRVWGFIRDGEIPSVKLGKVRRVPVAGLKKWTESLSA